MTSGHRRLFEQLARALVLAFGHSQHEAIERFRHLDLTGQTAPLLRVVDKLEHGLFHCRPSLQLFAPVVGHVHMAGCAGTGASAISVDARDIVLHCALHQRKAWFNVNDVLVSVELDVGDFSHLVLFFFMPSLLSLIRLDWRASPGRSLCGYRSAVAPS